MPAQTTTIVVSKGVDSHLIEVCQDGTVCFRVRGDLKVTDIAAAGAVAAEHLDVQASSLLLDISGLDRVESGVLQRSRKLERFCVAVFVSGFGQRALYSMVAHLFGEQPLQPTRFFVSEEAARDWVHELRQQQG